MLEEVFEELKKLDTSKAAPGQGLIVQYCLIAMLQKREKSVKGKAFAALLTDLSKAFGCLMSRLRKVLDICLTQPTKFNKLQHKVHTKFSLEEML